MSADRIDVLAVLDAEVKVLAGESWPFNDRQEARQRKREKQLREARAAVAELIEAASCGHDMPTAHVKPQLALYFNPQKADRLRAALARVGAA